MSKSTPHRIPVRSALKAQLAERYEGDLRAAVEARLAEGAPGLDLEQRRADTSLWLRLDAESERRVEQLAEAHGLTKSDVILRVLEWLSTA